jgi:hypothetical protein
MNTDAASFAPFPVDDVFFEFGFWHMDSLDNRDSGGKQMASQCEFNFTSMLIGKFLPDRSMVLQSL